MSELRVATRYAKSLIDLSQEKNELEQVKKEVEYFLSVTKSSAELQAVLRNPIIPIDKKKKILEAIFASGTSEIIRSFFNIIVDKGRAEVLYPSAKEFINQYNEKKEIVKAKVVSATELTGSAEKEIVSILEQTTGKKVILEKLVDAGLIGGFVLTVGDKQFDTSISKSLNNLKKSFESNHYVSTL